MYRKQGAAPLEGGEKLAERCAVLSATTLARGRGKGLVTLGHPDDRVHDNSYMLIFIQACLDPGNPPAPLHQYRPYALMVWQSRQHGATLSLPLFLLFFLWRVGRGGFLWAK